MEIFQTCIANTTKPSIKKAMTCRRLTAAREENTYKNASHIIDKELPVNNEINLLNSFKIRAMKLTDKN